MEFAEFKVMFQAHVTGLLEGKAALFETDVDKDRLWEMYLDSFPAGTNEIYRKRREMDCGCCRAFVRQFGHVVAVENNHTVSIWDFEPGGRFTPVMRELSALVKGSPIRDVFVTKQAAFGTDKNREQLENDLVHVWEHFFVNLPDRFVDKSTKPVNALMAEMRDTRNVLKRSLDEISKGAIETVLDLIAEKALYRGEEWQTALGEFLKLHNEYHGLSDAEQEVYCWVKSVEVGGAIGRIRNHSIGVLLTDLTNGVDADTAIRRYEAIVAPTNYKRPKAIFTAKMVEQAQQTITELGLLNSLGRRHATLADITINNVIWANRDAQKHMDGVGGVFDLLKQEAAVNPKRFDHVPGIGIDEFVEQVLPSVSSLEVLVENRHEGSLFSLIAPKDASSPTLFKWDNTFSWAYNGNIADSMKQRVKAAGGNVDGVLRFSLQWNENGDNQNDFDAHCYEPGGNHIWFRNKRCVHQSSGMLDVDIIKPGRDVAVENITWTDINRMPEGIYEFSVHNYSHRGGRSGFRAEIEYDGQVYEYDYPEELVQNETVRVARIQFSRRDGIKFLESLPTTTSTKTVWGIQTNQFHPVSVFMFSPNYWDGQRGIGHKHYFFVLAGCKNEDHPNGFFNEYLREDFMPHKRVFEALGSKMRVDHSEDQLSGLGFSSTKRNSLICRANDRLVKVIF